MKRNRWMGYIYINIDDCWMSKSRNNKSILLPDKERFPNGIKALAKYCHDKGLRLGIYSSAGYKTCQGLPGSLGYEEIDAKTWAEWEIDYVKYDNCYHDDRNGTIRYTKMGKALNATGREMFYSICNWGEEKVWEWGSIGNSWRTTGDIEDNFDSVRAIYKRNILYKKYSGPGHWNDPDMLEIGNGKMTTNEYRTHFALWAMAKAPLLIGCDLSSISKQDLEILMNKDIIDLNKDELGIQADCRFYCNYGKNATQAQVSLMELSNGDYAIALTNWNDGKAMKDVEVVYKKLELTNKFKVKDLWKHVIINSTDSGFTVGDIPIHDTMVYRLIKL